MLIVCLAMVSVAEQFGNLRHTLGSVLGVYTLMRWIRSAISKLTGRPPPASARELTPAKFAKFTGRMPDGSPAPPRPSRKPLAFFLMAVFGLPYLMGKLIKALAKNQEEEQKRREGQMVDGPIDPNQLEFYRVLYDFTPDSNNQAVQGVNLAVKRGDMVAVLSKADPLGNPSEWWNCRTRDGRMGYLPSPYLEMIQRRLQGQITTGSAGTSPVGSRAQTMTTTAQSAPASRASTLTGMKVEDIVKPVPEVKGKPNEITVESFQKSMFNNS
jgi:peroxin-13